MKALWLILLLFTSVSFAAKPTQEKLLPTRQPGFFTEGDLLWWRAEVSNMNYAYAENNNTQRAEELNQIHYQWHAGFRAIAGYGTKALDIFARYTFFRDHGHSSTQTPAAGLSPLPLLFSTLSDSASSHILSAESKIELDYDLIDLAIGHYVYSDDPLIILMWMGLRGAFLEQDWHTSYVPFGSGVTFSKNKWDVKGGGIVAGMEASYEPGYGFLVLMGGSLSQLLANQKTHFTLNATTGSSPFFNADVSYSRNKMFPVVDLFLGLGWRRAFCNWAFAATLRYELTQWWSINDIQRLADLQGYDDSAPGDLGLQGLTGRLRLDF